MFTTLDGVLNQDAVQRIRGVLSRVEWEDGRATARGTAIESKRNFQAKESPEVNECQKMILSALQSISDFVRRTLPIKFVGPVFSKTETGGGYGWHVDSALMRGGCRTDISATIFLSDPSSYDGGELEIEGLPPIKPKAGSIVYYPSDHIHRVKDVEFGERLVGVIWIQSTIQNEKERRIIADLTEINDWINKTATGSEEALKLGRIRGELYRKWSDPP